MYFQMTAKEPRRCEKSRWREGSRWCENPFSHLLRRIPRGIGPATVPAGRASTPEGSRDVATGEAKSAERRTKRNPWGAMEENETAPEGRRKLASVAFRRPSGAGPVGRTITTGGVSRSTGRLHPWLHSSTPFGGQRASHRKCCAPSGIVFLIANWTLRHPALACAGTLFILLGPRIALAQQAPPKPSPAPIAPERPNEASKDEPGADKQAEELGKRLLRKAVAESDEDVMATTLRLMGESERKLGIDFDPGDETQQVQSSILDKLNDAIKTAGKRRMGRGGQASWSSDRRRSEGAAKPQPPPEANRKSSGAGGGDAEGTTTPTAAGETKPVRGDLQETRRSWGLLPQRERDEMIQGSSEGYIERYREWIERYYRALQESGE